jgi:peptidoglycan/LPS O-acetylase OafA/YrhL
MSDLYTVLEVFLPRIKELDGLRAIAILGVFSCHFTRQYTHAFDFMGLGWAGVDLFFAISGFLITGILIDLQDRRRPYRTFYGRRILRIFPPYYLALTLILLLAYLHREHVSFQENIRYWLFASSAKLSLIKLAFEHVFWPGRVWSSTQLSSSDNIPQFRNWLSIYWSLSIEEIFYLVWAPVILKGSRRTVVLFATIPLLVCPILRGLAHTPSFGEAYGFVFRCDALTAGGVIALLFLAVKKGHLKAVRLSRALVASVLLSFCGLALLCRYCGLFRIPDVRATLAFSVFGYSLLSILAASLVGVCAVWSGNRFFLFRALRSKPSVYLGKISYVMYLIHMPVYVSLQLMLLKYLGKSSATVLDMNNGLLLLLGILTTICTVVLAGLSWKYFETPILRLKDRQFPALAQQRPVRAEVEVVSP